MRFESKSASVVDTSSVLDYSKVSREDLVHQTIYMAIPRDNEHRLEDILDRYYNPPYSIADTTGTSDKYYYVTTNKEFIGNSTAPILYRCEYMDGCHVPRTTYELVVNVSDLQSIINANSNFIVTYNYIILDSDLVSVCDPSDIGVDNFPAVFRYREGDDGSPYVEEISIDPSSEDEVANKIEDIKTVNPVLLNILKSERAFMDTGNPILVPQSIAVRVLVTVMDTEAEVQLLNIIRDIVGVDLSSNN